MTKSLLAFMLALNAATLTGEDLELPFVVDSKKPAVLVQAKVGGRAATLLLDTGSAHTILRPEIVGLSAFELNKSRFSENGIGMNARGLWALAQISLAERAMQRKVAVVAFDLSEHYRTPIDGLLGQDILREYRSVTIDFDQRKLILRR